MTEAQREAAARELCRLRGIDPDALVAHSAESNSLGWMPMVQIKSPAWKHALAEIAAREQIDAAMRVGMEAQG